MTLAQLRIYAKRLQKAVTLLTFAGVSILITLTWLERFNWTFEMVANFLPYYLLAEAGLGLIFLRQRRFFAGILALIFLLLAVIRIWPAVNLQSSELNGPQPGIKILTFNVSSRNNDIARTIAYLKEQKPDVFGLIEINEAWGREVHAAFPDYQLKIEAPKDTRYGIGLFSRLPLSNARFKFQEITGVPAIVADLETAGQPLTIILMHPFNPLSRRGFDDRNLLLKKIALARGEFARSLVVMGDFNTPPWSLYFRLFVKALDLRDARRGYGLRGTWPTFIPLVQIPIDHILVNGDFSPVSYRRGPRLGSDHFPVSVMLQKN